MPFPSGKITSALGLALLVAVWLPAATLSDFNALDIDGKPVDLADYRGAVVMVVNTASHCGYTYQYEGLEALYQKYKGQGLVILGFPSNDFLGQEPGSNQEIKAFCTDTYKVSFPLFGKIAVNGNRQHPLYKWLTAPDSDPGFSGKITWNFNKFLLGRDGKVVARFDTAVKPESPDIIKAVEAALSQQNPITGK